MLDGWQKDWSNGFNCLWSEDIMTSTQMNLMEIKYQI